jgi:hypothetical protein
MDIKNNRKVRNVKMSIVNVNCNECCGHKVIYGVRTCGLRHEILKNDVIGCNSGINEKDLEREKLISNKE